MVDGEVKHLFLAWPLLNWELYLVELTSASFGSSGCFQVRPAKIFGFDFYLGSKECPLQFWLSFHFISMVGVEQLSDELVVKLLRLVVLKWDIPTPCTVPSPCNSLRLELLIQNELLLDLIFGYQTSLHGNWQDLIQIVGRKFRVGLLSLVWINHNRWAMDWQGALPGGLLLFIDRVPSIGQRLVERVRQAYWCLDVVQVSIGPWALSWVDHRM